MTYALFIDDERFPPEDGLSWKIARNARQVEAILTQFGPPGFISFDHDLGDDEPTGHDIAHKLVDGDIGALPGTGYEAGLPLHFRFTVHSQNPVGARNIEALLTRYLEFRKRQTSV
ncbi:cyclic-phosphate processing receiver domain-containing protein [Antarcticimicrobium sediminis]|uniref:Cyclic-phosphate processing Receiver domain-containing protein n=1 Tax=Antarcticimicrobium sediminis TaxID=2546227 RepID=A0A4R5EVL8_9RHOB|nr:cyclic-phosphate processing receiver domain-containing protein [Antarcticimicrobium sediminis]TDE38931.1 hypothetical protein E1B25_07890 [Antarcticimicrobium sediminis]